MRKKHVVTLTDDQRAALDERDRGPLTRRERNRVHILLRADAGETDADIADDLGVSAGTVANVRRRFAAGGLDPALTEKPRPGAAPLLDGKAEAVVIALACSPTPDGAARWSARLLANKLVELAVVRSVSEDTILRVLKKVDSLRDSCGPVRGVPGPVGSGSREHPVVEPGDVLHHQRVAPPRVPIPLGCDPPHLHLPDPVFHHDPPLRHPPVPGLLAGR